MSSLTSNMKVTKIVQKYFLCTLSGFLVTIICDIKIDVNMCEPHYVNLFFCNLSIVQVFDFFNNRHLFDNLTSFDILLPNHLCAPLLMGTGVMGHMGNVACPPSRSTWGYGNGVHEQ